MVVVGVQVDDYVVMFVDVVVELFDLVGVDVWCGVFYGGWQVEDDFVVWGWLLDVDYCVVDFY